MWASFPRELNHPWGNWMPRHDTERARSRFLAFFPCFGNFFFFSEVILNDWRNNCWVPNGDPEESKKEPLPSRFSLSGVCTWQGEECELLSRLCEHSWPSDPGQTPRATERWEGIRWKKRRGTFQTKRSLRNGTAMGVGMGTWGQL